MDITAVFGTAISGSNPDESTTCGRTILSSLGVTENEKREFPVDEGLVTLWFHNLRDVRVLNIFVRTRRIGLRPAPWQGAVLPLNYVRNKQ